MTPKTLLCTCEDVTAAEVSHAIDQGARDIESLKRATGFGTGMCQGKLCQNAVARHLAGHSTPAPRPEQLLPFTVRPPLMPTQFSYWASSPVDPKLAPAGGVPDEVELAEPALRSPAPVAERAKVVIIGGGIMGLALAWNLAERGETDVMVLEQGYLCAGASGRNGGGVRMQWGTPTLIALARRSIELMSRFARDMGINVWFRRGGYLFLAKSDALVERIERAARLHNQHGVPTEIISRDAAQQLVPRLTLAGVKAAAWNPLDAVVFPWPFLFGYAKKAAAKGVKIEAHTKVTGFELSRGQVTKVITDRGDVSCDRVVIAAGAWSPAIAALAGVRLPSQAFRHEICSSEPLKPFLGPLVSVLDSGLYFSQSMRGEIIGGMGDPREPAGLNLRSTMRFLARYSQALMEQLPHVGSVKVLRQWAGPYDVTPDNSPILGPTPGASNLLQMSGFVGHGFMMAPAVAERMAQWMLTGKSDELFERFSLGRFAEGRLEREEMIIG